jgi:hypothetical protein
LGDVKETIEMMQDATNSDEDALKGIKKKESRIMSMFPSLKTTKIGLKVSAAIVVDIAVIIFLYINAPALPQNTPPL